MARLERDNNVKDENEHKNKDENEDEVQNQAASVCVRGDAHRRLA